jgi:hypothetical protein
VGDPEDIPGTKAWQEGRVIDATDVVGTIPCLSKEICRQVAGQLRQLNKTKKKPARPEVERGVSA